MIDLYLELINHQHTNTRGEQLRLSSQSKFWSHSLKSALTTFHKIVKKKLQIVFKVSGKHEFKAMAGVRVRPSRVECVGHGTIVEYLVKHSERCHKMEMTCLECSLEIASKFDLLSPTRASSGRQNPCSSLGGWGFEDAAPCYTLNVPKKKFNPLST